MAKKSNKITFDEFVTKAQAKKSNKKLVADIYIDEEFGSVTFNRPTNNQILEYINGISNAVTVDKEGNAVGQDFAKMFEASKEIVYATCPFLQKKELHEALEIVDPFDSVEEVFGIQITIEIAEKLISEFDGTNIKDEVKN